MSPTHSINHKSWFYSQMQTHCGLPLFFHSCSFLLTPCRAQYPLKTQWQGWCCCILVNLTLLRRGQIQLPDLQRSPPGLCPSDPRKLLTSFLQKVLHPKLPNLHSLLLSAQGPQARLYSRSIQNVLTSRQHMSSSFNSILTSALTPSPSS